MHPLLNVENYAKMSQLLSAVFNEILFDEPTLKDQRNRLTNQQYELYLWGCDARNWKQPNSQSASYTRDRKQLQRKENAFRRLLDRHRLGPDWRTAIRDQINQKCTDLTKMPVDWNRRLDHYMQQWNELLAHPCVVPKLPVDEGHPPSALRIKMSPNHPLYLGEVWDTRPPTAVVATKTPKRRRPLAQLTINLVLPLYPDAKRCPTTGVVVDYGLPQNSLAASQPPIDKAEKPKPTKQLRKLTDLVDENDKANTDKELPHRIAARQFVKPSTTFSVGKTIRLTPHQRTLLTYGLGQPISVLIRPWPS